MLVEYYKEQAALLSDEDVKDTLARCALDGCSGCTLEKQSHCMNILTIAAYNLIFKLECYKEVQHE